MRTQTISLQKRAIALLSALVLAISMACVAPLSALAIDGSGFAGTIQATGQTAQVAIGDTISMAASTESGYQFKITVKTEGDYHVDYAITNTESDTGAATINKHSGVLTPSEAGTVTVTAYLLDCEQAQVQGVPCYQENVIDTATKTVTITDNTGDYGFQGNDLQIKLDTTQYTVSVDDSSTSSAYVNNVSGITAEDGAISIDYSQNYGIGSNTIQEYEALNAGRIVLLNSDEGVVRTLGTDMFLGLQDSGSKTDLTVSFDVNGLDSGTYTLVFDSGYKAGNTQGTSLGATVAFSFVI